MVYLLHYMQIMLKHLAPPSTNATDPANDFYLFLSHSPSTTQLHCESTNDSPPPHQLIHRSVVFATSFTYGGTIPSAIALFPEWWINYDASQKTWLQSGGRNENGKKCGRRRGERMSENVCEFDACYNVYGREFVVSLYRCLLLIQSFNYSFQQFAPTYIHQSK